MYPILNIAIRAARIAGDLIVKYYETSSNAEIEQKKNNNFSGNIKRTANSIIVSIVHKSYPYHSILSEENKNKNKNPYIQWIINSLDGITNFVKGSPHFAVSIAVRIKERTEFAVIYDPMRNELFTASRGRGAQLNGYRLRTRKIKNFNNVVLATTLPYKNKKYTSTYLYILNKLYTERIDFRITGSNALDLAYVATGRVDGYFGMDLNPRDFLAGELIARESGVLVCDCTTGSFKYPLTGNIIVGDPYIVKSLLMITSNSCLVKKETREEEVTPRVNTVIMEKQYEA